MEHSTVLEVTVPRDRVITYLSDPRHLVHANHPRPVVDRSHGPLATGSWFVLGMDQIRARIEYTAYEPPDRILVTVSMSGPLSGGAHGTEEFLLSDTAAGGTEVQIRADGSGSWIRWGPLVRAMQNRLWRRLARQIEADA